MYHFRPEKPQIKGDPVARAKQLYTETQSQGHQLESTQQEARKQIEVYLIQVLPLLQDPLVWRYAEELETISKNEIQFTLVGKREHVGSQPFTGFPIIFVIKNDVGKASFLHTEAMHHLWIDPQIIGSGYVDIISKLSYSFPNSGNTWKKFERRTPSGRKYTEYRKEIEVEDFLQDPYLFPYLQQGIEKLLQRNIDGASTSEKMLRSTLGLDMLRQMASNAEDVPQQDIRQFSRGIAEAVVVAHPRLREATTQGMTREQVTELVAIAVEERLARMQEERTHALPEPSGKDTRRQIIVDALPNIQQEIIAIAPNDVHIQQELHEAVKGYRDPKRVLNAALTIIKSLVPQPVQIVIAVLEAANELFGHKR